MYIIKNLPVFLPLAVAVIISLLGIYYKSDFNELSLKLVISIVVFYFVGSFIRNLILNFLYRVLEESERKSKLISEIEYEKSRAAKKPILTEELEPYSPEKFNPNEY